LLEVVVVLLQVVEHLEEAVEQGVFFRLLDTL
jgi:hypothetical protein